MTAATFDTLVFSKKLQTHGFAANQAEGLAESVGAVVQEIHRNFGALEQRMDNLEQKVEVLEHKIDSKISNLESTLIKWIAGISMGLFSSILGLALFMYQLIH